MSMTAATIMLFLIMNPLGSLPIFLSTLKPVDPSRHNKIIIRETTFAYLLLICFTLFGKIFLNSVHISEQALEISGGIILFIIAIHMIFPTGNSDIQATIPKDSEPFFVPLAIPMTAGPGALTTVMLFSTEHPEKKLIWIGAITIASIAACITLLTGRYITKKLGDKGLVALERLSGMILVAMAVEMFLSGINAYFKLNY